MLNGKSEVFVKALSDQSREFVIVGVTGKIGAGASDVARVLSGDVPVKSLIQPALGLGFEPSELREFRIIQRYIRDQWEPFTTIAATSVMLSFLLDSSEESLQGYDLDPSYDDIDVKYAGELIEKCLQANGDALRAEALKRMRQTDENLCFDVGRDKRYSDRSEDASLEGILKDYLDSVRSVKDLLDKWGEAKKNLRNRTYESFDTYMFCFGLLPALAKTIEKELAHYEGCFTSVFQRFGNNIRAFGAAAHTWDEKKDAKLTEAHLFDLPERMDEFIKAMRHYVASKRCAMDKNGEEWQPDLTNHVRVVLLGFKNAFEALYFRQRYASFYHIAVSVSPANTEKEELLHSCHELGENVSDVKWAYRELKKACEKERHCSAISEDEYRDLGLTTAQFEFCRKVLDTDPLRDKCYTEEFAPFILQDVTACIESADVFVTRNIHEPSPKCDHPFVQALARFVTLVFHPGLVKPTGVERCMQVAMTAKLNSGCLSRQVGAVVTDAHYNILSLGWNDAPCGSETCMRRNLFDLINKYDEKAYSSFELNSRVFRDYMAALDSEIALRSAKEGMKGLPSAFCFKDVYQDIIRQRDQIHTRALHAEERALAACGNDRTEGGCLFTTSSPCELCAKKAKEAGISKIYYIEQYPGISHDHIIDDGPTESRAEYDFFTGAVGSAYVKLYTPLIPFKDELQAIGFSPRELHKDAMMRKKQTSEASSLQPSGNGEGTEAVDSSREENARAHADRFPGDELESSDCSRA